MLEAQKKATVTKMRKKAAPNTQRCLLAKWPDSSWCSVRAE